jgi:uncharacterized membrane protein YdjX (TVP38/TMEM64 family)
MALRRKLSLVFTAVLVVVAGGVAWRYGLDSVLEALERVPVWGMVLLTVVLPLVGFPVTALYLAVGARFGVLWGAALVVPCTVAHLWLSAVLARPLRKPMRRLLEGAGWKMREAPEGSRKWFVAWVALLPGLSYSLKNYAMPLAGVPQSIVQPVAAPLHVFGAMLALLLGESLREPTWQLGVVVLVYGVALLAVTRMALTRMRAAGAEPPA